jgi:hypothetical protein
MHEASQRKGYQAKQTQQPGYPVQANIGYFNRGVEVRLRETIQGIMVRGFQIVYLAISDFRGVLWTKVAQAAPSDATRSTDRTPGLSSA